MRREASLLVIRSTDEHSVVAVGSETIASTFAKLIHVQIYGRANK
jgi:hypothetical protein